MEKSLIQKRIKELSNKDYLDGKSNLMLFKEYEQDKMKNIPLEDSDSRTLLIMGNERLVYLAMKKYGVELVIGKIAAHIAEKLFESLHIGWARIIQIKDRSHPHAAQFIGWGRAETRHLYRSWIQFAAVTGIGDIGCRQMKQPRGQGG